MFKGEALRQFNRSALPEQAQIIAAALRMTGASHVLLHRRTAKSVKYGLTWNVMVGTLVFDRDPPAAPQYSALIGGVPSKQLFTADFVLRIGARFEVMKSRDPNYQPDYDATHGMADLWRAQQIPR